MSADISLAAGFLGFVVALSLAAVGIWKLDLRLVAAGTATGGLVWLAIACTSPVEWTSHKLLTVYLRPVDSASGESVADAIVEQIETHDDGSEQTYRLPTNKLPAAKDDSASTLAVFIAVQINVTGSLREQRSQPVDHLQTIDQFLRISAPRYRPWRGSLKELLPHDWMTQPLDETPIDVALDRE